MKKLFILSITVIMFTSNAFAATYVLYYQTCENCMWQKGLSYNDYATCMNAVKYTYSWTYAATCNSE